MNLTYVVSLNFFLQFYSVKHKEYWTQSSEIWTAKKRKNCTDFNFIDIQFIIIYYSILAGFIKNIFQDFFYKNILIFSIQIKKRLTKKQFLNWREQQRK